MLVGIEAGCLSHLLLTEEIAQAASESGRGLKSAQPQGLATLLSNRLLVLALGGCFVDVPLFQLNAFTGD